MWRAITSVVSKGKPGSAFLEEFPVKVNEPLQIDKNVENEVSNKSDQDNPYDPVHPGHDAWGNEFLDLVGDKTF